LSDTAAPEVTPRLYGEQQLRDVELNARANQLAQRAYVPDFMLSAGS